jgi:hypothetical protein
LTARTEDTGPLLQTVHDLGGRCYTDVGAQQCIFDLFPGVVIEAVAGKDREQAAAQSALRTDQS